MFFIDIYRISFIRVNIYKNKHLQRNRIPWTTLSNHNTQNMTIPVQLRKDAIELLASLMFYQFVMESVWTNWLEKVYDANNAITGVQSLHRHLHKMPLLFKYATGCIHVWRGEVCNHKLVSSKTLDIIHVYRHCVLNLHAVVLNFIYSSYAFLMYTSYGSRTIVVID